MSLSVVPGKHGFLPAEFLRVAEADAFVEHLPRHQGCGILHFVPGASVEGIGGFEGFGSLEIDGDDELPGLAGHVNILGIEVDGRGEFAESIGEFLACLIGHVLPQYLERLGIDAKEEPTSLGVEEGATGLHPGGEFAGGLFGFHDAVLVPLYDGFYFLYGQIFHGRVSLRITNIQLFGGYSASHISSIFLMASLFASSVMSM